MLLHFDATWLFHGNAQIKLPLVSKLVMDAYLAFVKAQKLGSNIFYTVPWHTINLLFPPDGKSPSHIKVENRQVDYCHDRVINTLHLIAIELTELKVLD